MEMMKLWALFSAVVFLSVFTALGQEPGTELWHVAITQETFQDTTVSSPAIADDGTIYLGSSDTNGGGRLYAISPTGTTNWTFRTEGEIRSSPAIGNDGSIYFGSLDGVIVSLNTNGLPNWTIQTGEEVRSSPAIAADGTIYIGVGSSNQNSLLAILPDGTTNWIFEMGVMGNYGDSEQFSSPSIGSDGTIYVGSLDGNFYSIHPDGTTNWTFAIGDPCYGSPTIGPDGTIYFGADSGELYALAPDGTEKWSVYVGDFIETTPAIGADGNIYFGGLGTSSLYCVDPTGQTLWVAQAPIGISASPAVAADGTIYAAGYKDGMLYAITSSGQTNKWVFDAQGKIFASPTIAPNGTIYFVAGPNLFAIYETNGPGASVSPMFRRDRKHNARATQVALDGFSLLSDGSAHMNLHVEPGASYRVQASTDLMQWLDLTNFVSSAASVVSFTDTNATNFSQRFYRIASP
jgi:outer membrane protein assembly factor BamB